MANIAVRRTNLRKRGLVLVLTLLLLLSGCTSMLERDYVSSTRHVEYHVDNDLSVFKAESYQGLVSALLYFVGEHAETGVVHLSNYTGDVGADLAAACAEVMKEDPLGAYALENIEHTHTRIVSYYEVNLKFDYTRTEEELNALRTVGSAQSMVQLAVRAMAEYEQGCVIGMNHFSGDEAALLTRLRQRWLDTPLVLVEPEVRLKFYPDHGSSRIVEFHFVWPEERESLAARSNAALAAAQRFLQDMDPPEEELDAGYLTSVLRERVTLDEENGGSTAYSALVEGIANRQGMTCALQLLCQQAELTTTVVEGWAGGQASWWLIVSTPEGETHLDPNGAQGYYCDETFRAMGYEWSAERYPVCDYEQLPQSEPGEPGEGDAQNPGEQSGETAQEKE